MKYEPSMIPEFISQIKSATLESEIQSASLDIKEAVSKRYPNENSRRKPMVEIRKAVRETFPPKPADEETEASFPYYFTNSGKGNINRLEHLAIRHLREDWNTKPVEPTKPAEVVKPVLTIGVSLESLGLTNEELLLVREAIADADAKKWLKETIMQRAKAAKKHRESLKADFSDVPSDVLMNESRYRTNSAACRELVSRAVRVIKQWNFDHPEQKWCITNKLISELTGITVKAIARAVEGMDIESYNQGQDLSPVVNRMVRAAAGEPSEVMSLAKVTSVEGSEQAYQKE